MALPNEPGNRFISIHALREEGDVKGWLRATEVTRFLSTPSARRATARSALSAQVVRDFYPRPPRGGRPEVEYYNGFKGKISIHALREEGDVSSGDGVVAVGISIHALREEGDRSCRGFCRRTCRNFYPRPPRGGRPGLFVEAVRIIKISIHALREEGDDLWYRVQEAMRIFLSTPSARRATGAGVSVLLNMTNFYPRPPRGGRLIISGPARSWTIFLSTPSARRATVMIALGLDNYLSFLSTPSARRATMSASKLIRQLMISIHALREEGDLSPYGAAHEHQDFYPRPPRGGRRCRRRRRRPHSSISIHALREEGDPSLVNSNLDLFLFLSTPSARRATVAVVRVCFALEISIHALREEGDQGH